MAGNGDPWRDDKKMRLVLLFSRKREQCALDQMWEVSISEGVCVCEWVWGRTNVWVWLSESRKKRENQRKRKRLKGKLLFPSLKNKEKLGYVWSGMTVVRSRMSFMVLGSNHGL